MTETTRLLHLCILLIIIDLSCTYSDEPHLRINKCCEVYELLAGNHCTHVNHTRSTTWEPHLKSPYTFATGFPDCGSHQGWHIYSNNSTDILLILSNGVLRHSLHHSKPKDDYDDIIETDLSDEVMHYDYQPGRYCMDKKIDEDTTIEYALVCVDQTPNWTNPEFLMRNIVSPVTHGISIICLLFIAIVYFVMPTLRDLVGNIVTTISMCLVVNQAADMARLLSVLTSHISLIIIETFCYISLLGAFFWLNSLGYYIWKTFKSRNVFLRITDGKKYCYYSMYCWSCTIVMGLIAIFAHYTMDYPAVEMYNSPEPEQESIGSLGIIIFFMPVAITVLINIFFFATTFKIINSMNTYGRIHHKLRHSFRMFLLLFLVMTITWIFFLMSFTRFEGLIYCHIIVNAFKGPIILYICVINQKHVSYQIKKNCCYTECFRSKYKPEPEYDWGDELTAMNPD